MSPEWAEVADILEQHWNEEGGYTSPNDEVYPWRWLWDSCFHALLWSKLRPDRAVREIEAVFRPQDPETGFVPHVHYWGDSAFGRSLWGRDDVSTITQPPMYGHAIRRLVEDGVELSSSLIESALRGLRFFLDRRIHRGLVVAVHPWETGCDDSPRWDSWVQQPFSRHAFALIKGRLVGSLVLEGMGVAVGSTEFGVGSIALTALVAFNALELAVVAGDQGLADEAAGLVEAIESRWLEDAETWVDGGPDQRTSGTVPTLEALLPVLVTDSRWEQARSLIRDPNRFAARFGPRQVDRAHPSYRPDEYWRGAAWPQLSYLFWVAASRRGDWEWADELAQATLGGAVASAWSEYWHPETGEGLGASPQSWTGLAALMSDGGQR